jgi:hypothetical protein
VRETRDRSPPINRTRRRRRRTKKKKKRRRGFRPEVACKQNGKQIGLGTNLREKRTETKREAENSKRKEQQATDKKKETERKGGRR